MPPFMTRTLQRTANSQRRVVPSERRILLLEETMGICQICPRIPRSSFCSARGTPHNKETAQSKSNPHLVCYVLPTYYKKHDFTGFIYDKVHRFPTNPLWQALRDVKNQVRSVRFITRGEVPPEFPAETRKMRGLNTLNIP